ncbi:MAG: PD40 domain-containing protein [Candidatus Hydrogenedentes bacterium]|nr:PD40 domain-containing protein [Candidatus Hydrogenedentota bacterium]
MLPFLLSAGIALGQAPTGQVAFLQQLNEQKRRVVVVDIATGQISRACTGPWDASPVWSPDGSKLAYSTSDGNRTVIRVITLDGSPDTAIPHARPHNESPAWSPDGSKLAYSASEGGRHALFVYEFAAGAETQWGKPASEDGAASTISMLRPAWRSDDEIVVVGVRNEKDGRMADLYELGPQSITILAEERGKGVYVEWAPATHPKTGMLAYESNDGGDREIFVSGPRRMVADVSNHRDADWNPVWSPDGGWIAFESFRDGPRGIYKVTPQRTVVTPIAVDASSSNWSPSWSPDGKWIAFISTRTGKPALHICRENGSDARAITNHDAIDLAPAWRPAKTK